MRYCDEWMFELCGRDVLECQWLRHAVVVLPRVCAYIPTMLNAALAGRIFSNSPSTHHDASSVPDTNPKLTGIVHATNSTRRIKSFLTLP